ncbi:potassium channel family protein [Nitratifractor sp.]|uniref:potassium channel family protein n=1 Tax=Nitratifractor sp. TaxID=2268144 RepID=UPI0025E6E6F8|nr:potassium channel family protein [Nitratifractor sp.]
MTLRQIDTRNNFLYLLIALVAILFSSAVADDFPGSLGEDLFSLVSLLMLIVGIKSLRYEVSIQRIAYTLVVILGGLTLLWRFYPGRITALLILATFLLIFVSAFKLSVRQILFEGRVDANKIIGSLSLYLLIGLIWTILYLMLLTFDPSAFHGIEMNGWRTLFSRMAYYSFVTLTTLGYGDITPANHVAEFLAYMEAVTGVFYMAIFVSSLINRGREDSRHQEGE